LLLNTSCVVSSQNKRYISLFTKQELKQILLREDKYISFCESRLERRRRGICAAILRSIWIPKLTSKAEVARVDRSGDRQGSTKHRRLTHCQLSMTRRSCNILRAAALEPLNSFGSLRK